MKIRQDCRWFASVRGAMQALAIVSATTCEFERVCSALLCLLHQRISQLLGSALKVLLIIMLLVGSVDSYNHICNNFQYVDAKKIIHNSGKHLAIINGTVTTVQDQHTLYIVKYEASTLFFIYDPTAHMYICLRKRENRPSRFVGKDVPKPRLCLFEQMNATFGYEKFVLKHDSISLKFYNNGKQVPVKMRRGEARHNLRHNPNAKHLAKFETFLAKRDTNECQCSRDKYCEYLRNIRHKINNKKILYVCSMHERNSKCAD